MRVMCRCGLAVLMPTQVLHLYLADLSITHTHLTSSVPGSLYIMVSRVSITKSGTYYLVNLIGILIS